MKEAKFVLETNVSEYSRQYEDCDILGLRFEDADKKLLKKLLPEITKPLMLRGETEVLMQLMEVLDRKCIIAHAHENNYKELVPAAVKGGHTLVIRTPIDINLAKEMNILTSDMGLPLDKILIDTDIGGLGYGLEYGYSMIEKIKLSNDKYLNMPIISFAVEETLKTKEAKSSAQMALMSEITAAAAVLAAGVDIIVMNCPQALKTLKGLQ
ncbi:MAG: hypothetical protein LBK53_01845 [Heliobacteriaceae bacterium]|nr:hypothetical protein [Heliobacteriaceae bacterium]